ncbi:hypothetical protein N7523_010460 [Penicillium sp. IBT 18751x]|nr:hypothetical protein N7523_010460 [Penicillium sp. IBT 18751x]
MGYAGAIPRISRAPVNIQFNYCSTARRTFHATSRNPSPILEPRLEDHGRVIRDEYSVIRDKYAAPKHPIVLAHGLLGFDELRLAGPYLPGVQYWRGIREALSAQGVEVITASVPPSSTIEERAEELARDIESGARGRDVNIIAHSMVRSSDRPFKNLHSLTHG